MNVLKKRQFSVPVLCVYALFLIHTALLQPVWCSKNEGSPVLELSDNTLRCLCFSLHEEDHHHPTRNARGADSLSSPACCNDTPAPGTWWAQYCSDTFQLDHRACGADLRAIVTPSLESSGDEAGFGFRIHPLSKFLIQSHKNPRFTVLRC